MCEIARETRRTNQQRMCECTVKEMDVDALTRNTFASNGDDFCCWAIWAELVGFSFWLSEMCGAATHSSSKLGRFLTSA